ncbi:Intradiol ring-cleavage dioxygenase [Amylostereum chailletii]|nr:Intradiol ring-cleavage dioxygenase [Amylostereum chailletii]
MFFKASFVSLLALAGLASAIPTKRALYQRLNNDTCVTAPSTDIGQDWTANAPVSANIAGGQEGVSMILDIGVMDTTSCQALPNVLVEVWAPNEVGTYGEFLRGATMTDANGIAEFDMIFPGFTSAGANHINVLVHHEGVTSTDGVTSVMHVGQLFFTDQWTNIVSMYNGYAANTNTRIMNNNDPEFTKANGNAYYPVLE